MPGRYEFRLPERPARDGWFRVGSVDVTTTALLVFLGVASMLVYAISQEAAAKLAFYGGSVRSGEVWRLVTWPVLNPPTEIWVVLTLAFFWFVGHRIEDLVGRRRFTTLIAAMTVLPAAFVSLFTFSADTGYAYGLSILGTGLLVVFALDNPGAMFFFGIPAWAIAAIFVFIDVMRLVGNRVWGQLLVELLAIVVALIGARMFGLLSTFPALRRTARTPRRAAVARPSTPRRRHTDAEVLAGPWAAPATATDHAADEAALNVLLDKIGATGMDSLTRDEKARLNELSKRLRER